MPVTSPSRPNVWLALYQHGLVWRTTSSFELATFFQVLERLPPRLPCRTFSPDRKWQKVRIISSGGRDVSGLWPVHALGRHHPKKERLLRRPRRRSGVRRRLRLKLRKPLGSNPGICVKNNWKPLQCCDLFKLDPKPSQSITLRPKWLCYYTRSGPA